MTAQKFKLFIGYLGNGATVCNSAVYENGDYKTIAHISNAGNIKLYVKPGYIPEDAMEEIKKTAADHRKKTEERLALELSSDYGYSRTLEEIADYTPWAVSDALFKSLKGKERPEKCELIKACYIENF